MIVQIYNNFSQSPNNLSIIFSKFLVKILTH
nr:MAG TPA: hypothetical protein [Bacteriophage sp.]